MFFSIIGCMKEFIILCRFQRVFWLGIFEIITERNNNNKNKENPAR